MSTLEEPAPQTQEGKKKEGEKLIQEEKSETAEV